MSEENRLLKRLRNTSVKYIYDTQGKIMGVESPDGRFRLTANGPMQPGTPGRDGADGAPGAAGRDGVDGAPGAAGKDGTDGAGGQRGPQGVPGAPGRDGIDGKDGTPGAAGKDGLNGIDGAPGRNGLNGADGLPGRDGAAGKDGAQGQQGIRGYTGADGVAGKDGAQGFQGVQGLPGKDGAQGVPGTPGKDGAQGATGTMPAAAFAVSARALNTAFLISVTRDAQVVYGVDVSITSVLGVTGGTAVLEYADNAAMSTNVVTVASCTCQIGGVLNIASTTTAQVMGRIPAGKYVRIRTLAVAGAPSFVVRQGQEVLI